MFSGQLAVGDSAVVHRDDAVERTRVTRSLVCEGLDRVPALLS